MTSSVPSKKRNRGLKQGCTPKVEVEAASCGHLPETGESIECPWICGMGLYGTVLFARTPDVVLHRSWVFDLEFGSWDLVM